MSFSRTSVVLVFSLFVTLYCSLVNGQSSCSGSVQNCQSAEFVSTNSAATGIAFSFTYGSLLSMVNQSICGLNSGTLNNNNIGYPLTSITGLVSTVNDPTSSSDVLILSLTSSFALNGSASVGTLTGTINYATGSASVLSTSLVLTYRGTACTPSICTSLNLSTLALPIVTQDTCTAPRPQAVGDPQFVGLRGQSYQVHGVDGSVYNLVSEKSLQVNTRFVFLNGGQCPIIDGVSDTNCWSHPGSYMGEVSVQQVVDGKVHAALLVSGDAKHGFSMVQVDGKALKVGDQVTFGTTFSIELISQYLARVSTEHFNFELSNSDMFINQVMQVKLPLSQLRSHGLLGQTHSPKTYKNALKYVEGDVDDYVIASDNIFGDDFVFNKFQL